jgi:large subunit ribosomal protein L15
MSTAKEATKSMTLGTLNPAPGHRKNRKRLGRGESSGVGGTSGKGHKGGQARTGYSSKQGFEGGQMPLQRRIPKFGFANPFRVTYTTINLERLQELAETHKEVLSMDVDLALLHKLGVVSKASKPLKVLGRGELKAKLTVKADKFSETAKAAIEKAGGQAISVALPPKEPIKKKNKK